MLSDLKGFGVSAGLYHAVASMYQHNTSRVLTSVAGVNSPSYSVDNGLREGAVLSPLLYCVFTAGLISKLKSAANKSYGLHVGTEWAGAQLWADDLLLMTSHENADTAKLQMQHLMRVLLADAEEKHYSYSACKTNVMIIDGTAATFDNDKKFIPSTTSDGTTTAWPLGTEVPSFKFLGTVLDKQLKWDEHITHRESAVADAMYYVRQLASHKNLEIKYTTREWERSCAQSLFYGAEALGLHTKGSWQRLNKHIARGAAVALGLHTSVTPEIAANDLQWNNAEYRVQLAQMRLLWELQHSAPRKARRIYRATVSSTAMARLRLPNWPVLLGTSPHTSCSSRSKKRTPSLFPRPPRSSGSWAPPHSSLPSTRASGTTCSRPVPPRQPLQPPPPELASARGRMPHPRPQPGSLLPRTSSGR